VKKQCASFYPNRYDQLFVRQQPPLLLNPVTGALVVDPATCDTLNGIVTQKTPGVNKSLRDPPLQGLEPRVGFAWPRSPTRKLLMRAGGGIYHGRDAFSQNSATGQLPPFNKQSCLNGVSFSSMTTPFNQQRPSPPGL